MASSILPEPILMISSNIIVRELTQQAPHLLLLVIIEYCSPECIVVTCASTYSTGVLHE